MNRITEALQDARDDKDALIALVEKCAFIADGEGFRIDGNCEADCEWDGVSRRCNCGNRRVRWTYENGCWLPECY